MYPMLKANVRSSSGRNMIKITRKLTKRWYFFSTHATLNPWRLNFGTAMSEYDTIKSGSGIIM